MSLSTAPDHVKLAVDLIELLEKNAISNKVAEQALELVVKDIHRKLQLEAKGNVEY
ncbi:DUF2496 domain-containing protein [Oceanospirillum maris]|jgi:hypothetical protein|uniref:DUF2496 domain-containing protein n=1 Tax=Oceanospirillum maris TaxID=64977 RepID=UPI0004127F7C|nr:DUF2496 domain-containing protein [Oceanospirillum maris]